MVLVFLLDFEAWVLVLIVYRVIAIVLGGVGSSSMDAVEVYGQLTAIQMVDRLKVSSS